jgi:hypothetical protein
VELCKILSEDRESTLPVSVHTVDQLRACSKSSSTIEFHSRCSPVEDTLKGRLTGVAWPDHLPWFLLGIRTGLKNDLNISSAELFYGAPLKLPGKFVGAREPTVTKFLEHLLFTPTTFPNQAASSLKVHKHEIFF